MMPIGIPPTFLVDLARLFDRMDAAYRQTAERSGFVCQGCANNCCRSLFFHHTLAEYLYLRAGLAALPLPVRETIRQRSAAASDPTAPQEQEGRPYSRMCPLNVEDRCLLYAHRPMICRLHGVPHRLRRPDGQTRSGPGCEDYERQCAIGQRRFLDRTPLYVAMSQLERELRRCTGFEGKIRMTIAQMVVTEIEGVSVKR
jgi:Fe-S-cluster containining protein